MALVHPIVRRSRFEPLGIVSANDFRLRRKLITRGDPHELIKSARLTPYCVDLSHRTVLFVEAEPKALLDPPLFYHAQYEQATAVVSLTFDEVAEVAGTLLAPVKPVIVYNVTRCGSTYLTKLLSQLPGTLGISEPDWLTQLVLVELSEDCKTRLIRDLLKLTIFPYSDRCVSRFVIKPRDYAVELDTCIRQAVPDLIRVFLYRNARDVVRSGMRVFRHWRSQLCWFDLFCRYRIARPLARMMYQRTRDEFVRLIPRMSRYDAADMVRLGLPGALVVKWLSAMDRAHGWTESGQETVPITYESIIGEHRANVIHQLMDACELRADDRFWLRTRELHEKDSQAETVVGRDRGSKWDFSTKDEALMQQILESHAVIRRPDFTFPNTIFARGRS